MLINRIGSEMAKVLSQKQQPVLINVMSGFTQLKWQTSPCSNGWPVWLIKICLSDIHIYIKHINRRCNKSGGAFVIIYNSNNFFYLLSMMAWLSCLLRSAADNVSGECLRKEWVLRGMSLVLPLAVWHVSSPLYRSNGFWEKSSGELPTNTTCGPGWDGLAETWTCYK